MSNEDQIQALPDHMTLEGQIKALPTVSLSQVTYVPLADVLALVVEAGKPRGLLRVGAKPTERSRFLQNLETKDGAEVEGQSGF